MVGRRRGQRTHWAFDWTRTEREERGKKEEQAAIKVLQGKNDDVDVQSRVRPTTR